MFRFDPVVLFSLHFETRDRVSLQPLTRLGQVKFAAFGNRVDTLGR